TPDQTAAELRGSAADRSGGTGRRSDAIGRGHGDAATAALAGEHDRHGAVYMGGRPVASMATNPHVIGPNPGPHPPSNPETASRPSGPRTAAARPRRRRPRSRRRPADGRGGPSARASARARYVAPARAGTRTGRSPQGIRQRAAGVLASLHPHFHF